MIKKTTDQSYVVSPQGDSCMKCCSTHSSSGTSSNYKPSGGSSAC